MSMYIQTLKKLFATLPMIANSTTLDGQNLAKEEIMLAHEHLEKAVACLIIDRW